MKKLIPLLLSLCMIITAFPITVYANGSDSQIALEQFAEQAVDIINSDSDDVSYEETVSKRVIVKSKRKIDTRDAIDIASGYKGYYVLEFPSAQSAKKAVEYYNSLNYVDFAQFDNVVSSCEIQEQDLGASESSAAHLSYNSNTAGFTALEKYNEDNNITYSDEITVAVIDTGVEHTHEFLQDRVEPTEYNFSDSGEENFSLDDNGHGTHVAGIIADNTPENVTIRPYKVLNSDGKGSTLSVILGLEQAIADDVDVINMSLSGKGYDEAFHNAVKDAYAKNIPVVVSSGNDGVLDLNRVQYSPASFEECITVAACGDQSGDYWGFRKYVNLGDVVDIAAPGDDIKSCYLNNTYKVLSGTSMAAPLVSAAVAYVLMQYPDMTSQQVEDRLCDYGELLFYSGSSYDPVYKSNMKGLYVEYITREIELKADEPIFSREGGEFDTTFQLILSSKDENCKIYYYLGDNEKSIHLYNRPIPVKYDTKVTAYCYHRGMKKSEWVSNTYTKIFTGAESEFEIDSKGVITEYLNDEETVVIPEKVNGITVTGIGYKAFANKSLKSVILPDAITEIGSHAFLNCKSLETVIGDITSLKSGAFQGCSSLVNIDISQITVVPDSAFSGCSSLPAVDFSKIVEIGTESFKGCTNIYSCVSDSLEKIGMYAFQDSNIELVNLPYASNLNWRAFENCTKLKKVVLTRLTNVNAYVFSGCESLEEIDFPNVQSVFGNSFYGCVSIERFYFPNLISIVNTMNYHFACCTALKEFIAPKLQRMGSFCFDRCPNLKTLVLPELIVIGKDTFSGNSSLEYLYAPKLQKAESLPMVDGAVIVTSSELTSCTLKTPNPTLVIQGERGSYAQDYADKYELEFVDVDAMGGSIRVTDAGLRFGFSFYDSKDLDAEEYGFIYSSSADAEHLNIDNADGKTVYKMSAPNRIKHDDGVITYNLVFTAVPKTAFDMDISARAYVKINGKYLYSDILVRSFNQIAAAVLADETVDENTKDAVRNLIDAAM